jgi:hypothetical protein
VFLRALTALCAAAVTAALVVAPTASAEVALNCGSSDQRTPSDKTVKQGVVVKTTYQYSGDYYDTYTIGDDGGLDGIYFSSVSSQTPLVSVWQNGTSCYGSDVSRNAWTVAPNGRVYTDNGYSGPVAGQYGDASNLPLNRPIVGMSPTSTGLGYWLVASDGGIFTYGNAPFKGSAGAIRLNKPIVGMTTTPSGSGYWMVATDGGIFTYGDANFFGSTGAIRLNSPIVGMTATSTGGGYWLVASDGGVFTFGNATFRGSAGDRALSAPIAGLVPYGNGYMLIGQDGTLYPFA